MNLSYTRIQHFLTIVKHMNLSRAAQELYISQPALSLSLSKIEEELGVSLFYRNGNKLILSSEGEALLPRFQEIQRNFDQLMEDSHKLVRAADEYITVGVVGSVMLFSTFYMTGFLTSYCGKVVKKFFADRTQITGMLLAGQLDFAIAYPPLTDADISNISLMTEPIGLAVSQNHSLAKKESVSLTDLAGTPIIGLSRHHYLRKLCDDICAQNGVKLHYLYEVEYPEYHKLIHKNAYSDSFAAFCPQDSFTGTYGDGYKFISIDHPCMCRTTSLAFLEKGNMQYKYAGFVEHIQKNFYEQHLYHAYLSSALKGINIAEN